MEENLWDNLKGIFWRYRWRFGASLLLVIVANMLLIVTPLIFRQAVTAMDTSASQAGGAVSPIIQRFMGEQISSLWVWVLILIAFAFSAAIMKYYMRMSFIAIGRDVEYEVRLKIFLRIQSQSMAFYDRHSIGELLSRLTNDISAYRYVLGIGIMYPFFFATLAIPALCALISISPMLAVVSIVPLSMIPLINYITRKRMHALSQQAQIGLADLSTMAQEHYSGIRIVKGYVSETQLTARFNSLCQSLLGINIELNSFQGLLYPFFNLITKMVTVVLVLFSALIILKSWEILSVADFVSFMWIQSYLFLPVLMFSWILPLYQRGGAAYERLVEIYNEPIEVKDEGVATNKIAACADIEFRDLTFHYPSSAKEILKNFSLHIKGNSFVGITGSIGAGKTTLFRILNREYEIAHGKLFVGGLDIHAYPLQALWEELVTVEQLPFLFSRTIAENVKLAKEGALQSEIEDAAIYADVHETIQEFPEQYNTLIGERGLTLSGGQRQRLALARAFLVNHSILLLDDVFSAVDTGTEMHIFEAMKNKLRNKTVIMITHRVSVLEAMDRVIYMRDGKVIEDGSPEELKAKKGSYAALVAIQQKNKAADGL